MTLYFAQPAQTVIPMLKVSGLQLVKVLLLKGENLSLDASETYVENVPDNDKQKGLVFKWECSSLVQAICDKNEGQQILTVEYNAVAASIVDMKEETITLVVQRQEVSGLREFKKKVTV